MTTDTQILIEKHINRIARAIHPASASVRYPIPPAVAQNIYYDFEDMDCIENIALAGCALSGATEYDYTLTHGDIAHKVREEIENARDRAALSDYVEHLTAFIDAGFPPSYERDVEDTDERVDWVDLAHFESHRCDFCDAWGLVSGRYHASMGCPVYQVESSFRAGYRVSRELFVEYLETLRGCLA